MTGEGVYCYSNAGDINNRARGNVQSVTLPAGTYQFYVFGGAGNDLVAGGTVGAKGGFSYGTTTFSAATTIDMIVAAAGGPSNSGGGGGGSDIRVGGLDDLSKRVIVAGGGGAGGNPAVGGEGGGGNGGERCGGSSGDGVPGGCDGIGGSTSSYMCSNSGGYLNGYTMAGTQDFGYGGYRGGHAQNACGGAGGRYGGGGGGGCCSVWTNGNSVGCGGASGIAGVFNAGQNPLANNSTTPIRDCSAAVGFDGGWLSGYAICYAHNTGGVIGGVGGFGGGGMGGEYGGGGGGGGGYGGGAGGRVDFGVGNGGGGGGCVGCSNTVGVAFSDIGGRRGVRTGDGAIIIRKID